MCDGTLYEGAKGEDATRHVPRGRKRVAARKAVMGLAFLATYVLLSPRFSFFQILGDEWLGKGRLERYVSKLNRRNHGSQSDVRLVEVQLIGIVERIKYYAVWSLAEASRKLPPRGETYIEYQGSCVVTGMGFSGYDATGRSMWDGVSNINIMRIEMAPNLKVRPPWIPWIPYQPTIINRSSSTHGTSVLIFGCEKLSISV